MLIGNRLEAFMRNIEERLEPLRHPVWGREPLELVKGAVKEPRQQEVGDDVADEDEGGHHPVVLLAGVLVGLERKPQGLDVEAREIAEQKRAQTVGGHPAQVQDAFRVFAHFGLGTSLEKQHR